MFRKKFGIAAALALGLGALSPAFAATDAGNYPDRPIKMIVPFPAGGTSDIMGRIAADIIGKKLGQTVVVENRGGAGGVIGTEAASRAKPDGYTLLLSGVGSNAIAQTLYKKLQYDSNKDFIQITQINAGPNVLVVNPKFPAKTLKEFVEYGKAHPGEVNFAMTYAASGHLAMEMLMQAANKCPNQPKDSACKPLKIVGIPYKGGAPGLTAVIGGQVQTMFINQDAALPYVQSGQLRALAVSSAERNPKYPGVPTVAESGYPGFVATSWAGISAPKGTPQPIIDKLNKALVEGLNSPDVKQKLEAQGFVVVASSPKQYADFMRDEINRWGEVIKYAKITPQ
ncbi:tripartite tricarboxylate transporter substrate binding protein [Paralcaligenes sp. KSB-10]|uniref:Bug family tripartite tricarboxylate transporter substrate binding protein n=1 Tax=Paralcaligenes sp. KSB-10 TaxID=2901142 RepID=UPI001E615527|nr:tripartite tricarboxylate transporter substrate binding protein [Paralcaligenes sp. KSB-10]UHL64431.1 tripartite tricarboxylate transporter substrate binding protein [Paralcaligenes sp. KSB-10]